MLDKHHQIGPFRRARSSSPSYTTTARPTKLCKMDGSSTNSSTHTNIAMATSLLMQLEIEIERITPKDAYRQATLQCPEVVKDVIFRWAFLQSARLDARRAAQRMTAHLETKSFLFGRERLHASIDLSHLTQQDLEPISGLGLFNKSDGNTKAVLSICYYRMSSFRSSQNMLKCLFGLLSMAFSDPHIKDNGLSVIIFNGNRPPPLTDALLSEAARCIYNFPLEISEIHCCSFLEETDHNTAIGLHDPLSEQLAARTGSNFTHHRGSFIESARTLILQNFPEDPFLVAAPLSYLQQKMSTSSGALQAAQLSSATSAAAASATAILPGWIHRPPGSNAANTSLTYPPAVASLPPTVSETRKKIDRILLANAYAGMPSSASFWENSPDPFLGASPRNTALELQSNLPQAIFQQHGANSAAPSLRGHFSTNSTAAASPHAQSPSQQSIIQHLIEQRNATRDNAAAAAASLYNYPLASNTNMPPVSASLFNASLPVDGFQQSRSRAQKEVHAAIPPFLSQHENRASLVSFGVNNDLQSETAGTGQRKLAATEMRSSSSSPSPVLSTYRVQSGTRTMFPCPLYIDSDATTISVYQCLVRKQMEFFEADDDDVQFNVSKMNKQVTENQIGIRCRYCAALPQYLRPKAAVYYPRTLETLYQFGQNMVKNHLTMTCKSIPMDTKAKLVSLRDERRRGKGGRQHWTAAAAMLGIGEVENGLRYVGRS